ncbi:SagB/ThcOx family dehydrogenase [Streptomyces sp. JJ38]|uniref:SagB/ThcOx family dehydrogenase n=1 Tax=Streptomyces sp. JJ38 TaxID=2738128 RepID=UPI001C575D40|nr:SagB/ThcOx family dehydrogenase [Streptomyces sp. JJ38]
MTTPPSPDAPDAPGAPHGPDGSTGSDGPGPRNATGEPDLPAELARARGPEEPGPDTPPGPPVPRWPGPALCVGEARSGEVDLGRILRFALAASDAGGRLRPASSAGGCHPVDVRLTVGADAPLPAGRYGYDPLRHRLHCLSAPPTPAPPGVRLELSVTIARTRSHYGHRAWPLALLDTGHAVAALWLASQALGAPAPELDIDGRTSHPLAVVRLPPPGAPRAEYPRPAPGTRQLLARRSPRPPLTGAPDEAALAAVLATVERAAASVLDWCVAVGGPEPGLLALAPDGRLRRLATGEARPTLAAWAARQGWLAESGAVLVGYGCPDDADAAHIRRAHLRAGYAVGLAQSVAGSHGLGARPVGSWQNADLGAALGDPPGRQWVVHGLALGAPADDGSSAARGARPAPGGAPPPRPQEPPRC